MKKGVLDFKMNAKDSKDFKDRKQDLVKNEKKVWDLFIHSIW